VNLSVSLQPQLSHQLHLFEELLHFLWVVTINHTQVMVKQGLEHLCFPLDYLIALKVGSCIEEAGRTTIRRLLK
jgi:hypothetical protein